MYAKTTPSNSARAATGAARYTGQDTTRLNTLGKLCAAACMLALSGCGEDTDTTTIQFQVPVKVAQVNTDSVTETIVATGTVRVSEAASLTVKTAGILEIARNNAEQRYAEGDHVEQGDVLVRIIGEDVRLATRMDAAKQYHETAKKNLEATEQMYQQGLTSVLNYGETKNAYESALLEYQNAQLIAQRTNITTPVSGVILNLARDAQGKPMANGQFVEQGMVLAQVAAMDKLIADIDLIGKDIALAQPGMHAQVRYHAWEDKSFDAKLLRLSPTVNAETRTLRAEVLINNKDNQLRPGMFVEVEIQVDKRENVPVIPHSALAERAGKQVVFVLDGQRVIQREVVLGISNNEFVEVHRGVVAGEQIVVLGLETLKDQMPVLASNT